MKFLLTKTLLTVAVVQGLVRCAFAAQDAGDDDGLRSDTSTALRTNLLPDSVKATILGMCYAASDAELDKLKVPWVWPENRLDKWGLKLPIFNLEVACNEIRELVDSYPAEFVQMQWTDFCECDLAHIQLASTAEGCSGTNSSRDYESLDGTVRAARWSVPGGPASATIRVDEVGYAVYIGVLTDQYEPTRLGYKDWEQSMTESSYAWSYGKFGRIFHDERSCKRDLSPLVPGSIVKVTLDAHRVIFTVDDNVQHTVTLSEHCSNITLGVTLCAQSKVTLLRP